jgi:hypothetical protein
VVIAKFEKQCEPIEANIKALMRLSALQDAASEEFFGQVSAKVKSEGHTANLDRDQMAFLRDCTLGRLRNYLIDNRESQREKAVKAAAEKFRIANPVTFDPCAHPIAKDFNEIIAIVENTLRKFSVN